MLVLLAAGVFEIVLTVEILSKSPFHLESYSLVLLATGVFRNMSTVEMLFKFSLCLEG